MIWSPDLQTVFIGCQNTSIQWFDFGRQPTDDMAFDAEGSDASPMAAPRKAHKFWDSYPQYERKPADLESHRGIVPPSAFTTDGKKPKCPTSPTFQTLLISANNVIDSAHFGYVYCMALLPLIGEADEHGSASRAGIQLITGSGDETVKVCSFQAKFPLVRRRNSKFSLSFSAVAIHQGWPNSDSYVPMLPWRDLVSRGPQRDHICWLPGWLRANLGPRDENFSKVHCLARGAILSFRMPIPTLKPNCSL